MHAVALADDLEANGVLVPVNPGVLSALGLLVAEFKRDYVQTEICRIDGLDVQVIRDRFSDLDSRAIDEVSAYRIPIEGLRRVWQIDMRYHGQAYELGIPIDLATVDDGTLTELAQAFHKVHAQRYGHASDDPLEIVNYRLTVASPQPPVQIPSPTATDVPTLETGEIYLGGAMITCRFCTRRTLPVDHSLEGPVVIEEDTATTFVPPGWRAFVDSVGNLQVERNS